uniref:BZIP domain-containing protein n=1 Tax=Globisporangium ultimum (strain ATCC 200006 / CBS 805.95 / DAOM BR144) TaxID=431595 RepID=K3WAD8_GLOUD
MQNPSGAYGANGTGNASHFGSYLQPNATVNAGGAGANSGSANAADLEGDLPSSLPSYMPPNPQQQQPSLPFFASRPDNPYGPGDGMPSSAKRQAPTGQWKTPPQFLYAANPNAGRPPQPAAAGKPGGRESESASPSAGMRSMTFQEGTQLFAGTGMEDKSGATGGAGMKLTRQDVVGGISAAQFAASTGGLTMDTALLARVSGTDPSRMGSEEIKQIMRTPDLLSIYQKLQEEDDRRQRRLERNRASARVRREKKKSMVETYEGEVSKLENSLNLLKVHSFGSGQAQDLINALEYSSGENLRHALMSKDAKMELMARILGHHSRSTSAIHSANAENQALIATAVENAELFASLRTQLRLTDEQCRKLHGMAHHVRDEARKLDAIAKCFSALRAHDWLFFPGMETILHQSRNTMTPQQFQRFLTWTSDNKDVIDQLQVVPSNSPPVSEEDIEFLFVED